MHINKNFGYVLGVLVGDGFLDKNSVGLNVKDKDFALTFKKNFEIAFKKQGKLHFYNGLWRVLFHSRSLVNLLKQIDYHIISSTTEKVKCAFLKGFFDSEGSVYFRAKYGVRNRKIELAVKDYELLSFCKNLLEELSIKTRKIDKRFRNVRLIKNRILPPMYYFRFSLRENKNNFIRFQNLIGFSIERKQEELNRLINSYFIYRSKWKNLREKVLEVRKTKRYSEIRKEFNFIPKGTIDKWLYLKNPRVSEE